MKNTALAPSQKFLGYCGFLLLASAPIASPADLGPSAAPTFSRTVTGRPFFRKHVTRMREIPSAAELAEAQARLTIEALTTTETDEPAVAMAPTRSTFLAHWRKVAGVTTYRLDVSTDPNFSRFTGRYHEMEAGRVNFQVVDELQPDTTYYYRVRNVGPAGVSSYSETLSATTNSAAGFVIVPTFDPTIESRPDPASVKATITNAIGVYQSLFQDPITVKILFRYTTLDPSGNTFPPGVLASNYSVVYPIRWSQFITALKADGSSASDTTANGSLPANALTPNVTVASANGRALGLNTPPLPFPEGSGNPAYDGIVTFNTVPPLSFTRPTPRTSYDGLAACEHEMDEVLGLGSHLYPGAPLSSDLRPLDLFSWAAPAERNTISSGIRYFSIDGGVTRKVGLNQEIGGDFGDWESSACPQLTPRVQNAFACKGTTPNVSRSSIEGLSLDVLGYDLIPLNSATTLANISTRVRVGAGENVLIGGFIISGTAPKTVLLRALGPSLPSGLGVLPNPSLELHSGNAVIASNDDWQSDQKAEIEATGIAPTKLLESALIATLDPGTYTAIVQASGTGAGGVGLVEIYDLNTAAQSALANISTRGLVGTDTEVLIGGFIVVGDNSTSVLVRALGPSLPLSGTLSDPTLELHNGNGDVIVSNDDWRSAQENAIAATGIPPTKDRESALLATLAPGSYTAIVSGKDGTGGLALVEIYRLQD